MVSVIVVAVAALAVVLSSSLLVAVVVLLTYQYYFPHQPLFLTFFVCLLLFYINVPYHLREQVGNKFTQLFCGIPAIASYGEVFFAIVSVLTNLYLYTLYILDLFVMAKDTHLLNIRAGACIFSVPVQ